MDKKKKESLSFLPSKLRKSLMKFQRNGIRYGISKNGRCLIGDEMGLGKTLQAIGIAYYFKTEWPLLIIVPSSMRYGWVNELEKWLPCIQPGDINVISSCACLGSMLNSRISIISYGLLSQPRRKTKSVSEVINETNFGVIIIDESHYIKRMQSIRTKEVMKCAKKIPHKILLSGTPTLARPIELFPQIHLIQPQLFGSYHTFGEMYCNGHYVTEMNRGKVYQKYDMSGASNLDKLHNLLVKNVMIRRLKEQVLTQLPAKRRQKIMFEIGQNSKHKKELEDLFENLKKMRHSGQNELEGVMSGSYKTEFMRLFNSTAVAKAAAIQQYICDMLDGMQNKFIVFCFHLTMVQAVQQILVKRKVKHICITGEVSSLQRGLDTETFQTNPECRVAVLSIQAAATGLTLTAADHVIFSELHYTPGVLLQAEDRCHRIGQKNAVLVHYLVAMGTIDEFLWSCLKRKIVVTSATLNGKISELHVDTEDFGKKDLLSGLEAWQPVSVVVPNDKVENLFQKKIEHKDIRDLLSTESKKNKKRKLLRKRCEPIVVWSDEEEENEFKPRKKKRKHYPTSTVDVINIDEDKGRKHVNHHSKAVLEKDSSIFSKTMTCSESVAPSSETIHHSINVTPSKCRNYVNIDDDLSKDSCQLSVVTRNHSVSNSQTNDKEVYRDALSVHHKSPCLLKDTSEKVNTTIDSNDSRKVPHNLKLIAHSKNEKSDVLPPLIDLCETSGQAHVSKDDINDVRGGLLNRVTNNTVASKDHTKSNIATDCTSSSLIGRREMNLIGDWLCQSCLITNSSSFETCQNCQLKEGVQDGTRVSSPDLFDASRVEENEVECDVIDVFSSDGEEDIQSSGILLFDSESESCVTQGSDAKHDKSLTSSWCSEIVLDDDEEFDAILSQVDDMEFDQHTRSMKPEKVCVSGVTECIVLDGPETNEVENVASQSLVPGKQCEKLNCDQGPLLDFFDGSNDSLDQNLLNINTDEVLNSSQPDHNFSSSDDDDDQSCENDLGLRKIDFRYCMSRYTQRVFLYDKDDRFLEMKFSVQDMEMNVFEELPPLLSYNENLKQLMTFCLLWKQLGPVKQSLVKKSGRIFVDPCVFYKELYAEKYGSRKNNYKRYITNDEQFELAKQAAHTAGGKVIQLSAQAPKTNSKKTKAASNRDEDNVKQDPHFSAVYQAVDSKNCPLCLYCSSRIEGMKSGLWEARYCSQKCMEEHKIRTKGRHYGPRDLLFDIEHGICQICGINAHELFQEVSFAHVNKRKELLEATPYGSLAISTLNRMVTMPTAGLFWEADHMKAVVEGGGQCGLENYRTLCTPCHRDVTRNLRRRLGRQKKNGNYMNLKEFFGSQASESSPN